MISSRDSTHFHKCYSQLRRCISSDQGPIKADIAAITGECVSQITGDILWNNCEIEKIKVLHIYVYSYMKSYPGRTM